MSNQPEQLINDMLNLKNNAMVVTKIDDNILDFKSHIESKGWFGKAGVSFTGRAYIDPKKKLVTYWDMIKKTTAGMGGENMGFSTDTYSVKGVERSGTGGGVVPGGEKYSYDYGKVRELVRSVVEKNGWQFKTTLIKPKWWKGLFS